MIQGSAQRRAIAFALFAGTSACVRAPVTTIEPTQDAAKTCPDVDRFAAEFTNTRVSKWKRELEKAPGHATLAETALAQLERAREAHRASFERSCVAHLDDLEAWARHRACFDEARAAIRARFEISSQWAQDSPDKLELAPSWPWRLASSVSRCELPDVVAVYTPLDSLQQESLEQDRARAWVRAFAMAELGDLAEAERGLADLVKLLNAQEEPRLRFEAGLLAGWLALAAGDLAAAEKALGPQRTAATHLGPPALLDFAFFEGATQRYGGQALEAGQSFDRGRDLATQLGAVFIETAADAALQAAQAYLEAGKAGLAKTRTELARSLLMQLDAQQRDPAIWAWMQELSDSASPEAN